MGGEQAANVLSTIEEDKRKRKGDPEWPEDDKMAFKEKIQSKYDQEGAASFASARLWDDGVIDPSDTRRVLSMALTASMHEQHHLNSNKSQQTYGVFRM